MTRARARALVLASSSPRRRELLSRLRKRFAVRPADADESPRPGEGPEAMVIRLALDKARRVVREGELAIGADTVVALGERILGKPRHAAEARGMLAALAGREHEVWTGIAVIERGARRLREAARAVRTEVRFRALDEAEIAAYVASGEPFDRAGAYAIQGGAAGFVAGITGSWTNVVGLPLDELAELLGRFAVKTSPRT